MVFSKICVPLGSSYSFQEYLERDPVVRDYMVVLQSKDGHAQWVSKAMLEKMLPLPEEVDGGIIVRDESGNPTGDDTPRRKLCKGLNCFRRFR